MKHIVATTEISRGSLSDPIMVDETSPTGGNDDKTFFIALLKAILSFYHNKGVVPPLPAHSRQLYDFLWSSLLVHLQNEFPRPYVTAIILRLETVFRTVNGPACLFTPFASSLDQEIHDLCRQIWGGQNQDGQDGDQNEQAVEAKTRETIEASVFKSVLFMQYYLD